MAKFQKLSDYSTLEMFGWQCLIKDKDVHIVHYSSLKISSSDTMSRTHFTISIDIEDSCRNKESESALVLAC